MLTDQIRFAAFLAPIKTFAETDYMEKFGDQVTIRELELGSQEFDRLMELSKMYRTWIEDERNLAFARYTLGYITNEQYRMTLRFASRDYLEAFQFDQIEEMEFRYNCLKEQAIPQGVPFSAKLANIKLREWTDKMKKINNSRGE